jgi:catechol 2,3-dioxygenase-like lactoylglutathione lyase family enzyme
MPELKGFSHIDLTVSDRERAAAWWQDVMGFTVVQRWRGDSFDVRSKVQRAFRPTLSRLNASQAWLHVCLEASPGVDASGVTANAAQGGSEQAKTLAADILASRAPTT